MEIQKSTRVGLKGHYHLVYLKDDGTGTTSIAKGAADKGHIHQVTQVPPEIHPVTQEPMGEPEWLLLPAKDGHTHLLDGEVERTEEKDEKEDEEKVSECQSLYKAMIEYESESRKKSLESEEFYQGKQWKDVDKTALDSLNKACLTVNIIEAGIDVLLGYQRQSRTDIKYLPVEDGDGRIADILTCVAKNVCEQNDFPYIESAAFEDQLITGRGFFHIYPDYDKNIQGDIVIENYNWRDVYTLPHEKIDLSDCEAIAKAKWFSLEKLKQLYPDKADDITADWTNYDEGLETHKQYNGTYGDQYESERLAQENGSTYNPMFVDINKKSLRVIEIEKKLYKRVNVLQDPTTEFTMNLEGWKSADIAAVKTIPGIKVIKRPNDKMQRIKFAGNTILEDEVLDDENFSVIALYAKKRKEKWYGKVENTKDLQRQINKLHSQTIDIVNKTSNYGWSYNDQTFADTNEERNFKQNASTPGFIVKLRQNGQLNKIESSPLPNGIIELEQSSVAHLNQILNVNPNLAGPQAVLSPLAIVEGKKQGMIGNEIFFDNLNYAKKQIGLRLVKLIQEIYTPQRILRILNQQDQKREVEIGGIPLKQINPQDIIELLTDVDLTKFDVVVGESALSPTVQMSTFMLLSELMRNGAAIPPQMLLRVCPMPEDMKQEALQEMQAQAQAHAQAQQSAQNTEIQKTMIAAQAKQQITQANNQEQMAKIQARHPGQVAPQGMPPGMPPQMPQGQPQGPPPGMPPEMVAELIRRQMQGQQNQVR